MREGGGAVNQTMHACAQPTRFANNTTKRNRVSSSPVLALSLLRSNALHGRERTRTGLSQQESDRLMCETI